jgi:hypothetical protein
LECVWLLIKREEINELFEMRYMSLFGNGSLIVLSKININSNKSFLVSSHNRDKIED